MLEPGVYQIMAGFSSSDIRKSEEIVLQGEKRPVRDGMKEIEAQCFDDAENYFLLRGHHADTSVCVRDREEEMCLTYQNVFLEKETQKLRLIRMEGQEKMLTAAEYARKRAGKTGENIKNGAQGEG